MTVMSNCVYELAPDDPVLRVCVTHNPDLGLYENEQCTGNPRWWENAVAGICTHGGHDWDGETCSDAPADSSLQLPAVRRSRPVSTAR